jgi:pimeloyl-ACP methyl ester carboxylesterase
MDTRILEWNWRGKTIRLGADASGTGPKLLLLPALSSISSRREMHPLQQRLARHYSTLSVDWPGFGEGPRPQLDWTPDAYAAFLAFLLMSVSVHPHAIIAAGHAATYVLKHAASTSGPTTRLVLIAPTWRGPLPTMAGGHRPFFERLCRLVDRPALGPLI